MEDLLAQVIKRANRYINEMQTRRVSPSPGDIANLQGLNVPFQDDPIDPATVLAELDDIASPATVASTGGRFFGFVIGGCLPAPMAVNMLAGVWDQNAGLEVSSPLSSFMEELCRNWLLSLLGLPAQAGIGFVSGATMANFTGLAAARHALLSATGWDVESKGLFGAPEITVVVGEEVHVSVLKALSMLGLGRDRVVRVAVDGQGRMRANLVPPVSGPTIICIQAGNVNTGAFDPAGEICSIAGESGAWVHVDGAFGLWAAAAPHRAHLVQGIENADSWATDAHKWLNVPYDSGLVFVRDVRHLKAAMSASAAYLLEGERRDPTHFVPEQSRRARGLEIWAALRSLGKSGIANLIEGCCSHAAHFAEGLKTAGYQVLNDVVLNQVLVKFGSDEQTRRVIRQIQEDGTCWCGETKWQGHVAMRISVSSWATTAEDVSQSLNAITRIAKKETEI
jgi:glutamate/tyrosine decarboxylase-like PLP-dependent enzyme